MLFATGWAALFSIKPQPVILRTVGAVCSFCDCQVQMIAEKKEKKGEYSVFSNGFGKDF